VTALPPNEQLKDLRSRLGITTRDVAEFSQRIAEAEGNPEFQISNAWLTQIENSDSVPSIFKLYSLSAIYRMKFTDLLLLYGLDLQKLGMHQLAAPLPHTHLTSLEVYDAVKGLDRRIGVCMDIGHTFRMHEDLVEDTKKMHDRLYSMHFKDLDSDHIDAKGVPVGTGVLPIIPLLRELVSSGYAEELQLEYEVEQKDPMPGMAESLGFMRGALQEMSSK